MYFNGSLCKEGARASIVLISPTGEIISLMYNMEFQTTNNIFEYEALIIRLRAAKDLKIQQLTLFGDSELVVQQVKNVSQVKQNLLKVYWNEVWYLVDNFLLCFNIKWRFGIVYGKCILMVCHVRKEQEQVLYLFIQEVRLFI